MIRFTCPKCPAVFRVGPEDATRKGACPKCGAEFAVPEVPECNLVKLAPAPEGWGRWIRRYLCGIVRRRTSPPRMADYGD